MKDMAICKQNRTAERFYTPVALATAGTEFGRCQFGFSAQSEDHRNIRAKKDAWLKAEQLRETADQWIDKYPRTATAILSAALPAGILLAVTSLTVLTAVPIGFLFGWL